MKTDKNLVEYGKFVLIWENMQDGPDLNVDFRLCQKTSLVG